MAQHAPEHPKRRRHGKGKKRRMTKYIVNELSGVDAPAQVGARALIIKARGTADAIEVDLPHIPVCAIRRIRAAA